ncbi:MAG: universal stress protein [Desulfobacterales bacterium]|nr:universal stress protein [Desulfobacterales bacterium]
MFKKIMVPLDGSELAECVIPYVEGLIDQGEVEVIVFVRVVRPVINPASFDEGMSYIPEDWSKLESEKKTSAENYLKKVVSQLKKNGVKFQTEVLVGRVGDRLIDYIKTNDYDLILIATHGRSGLRRWVRGNVADKILSGSHIPILMVRAPGTMSEGQD